jgi:hypothetical protein
MLKVQRKKLQSLKNFSTKKKLRREFFKRCFVFKLKVKISEKIGDFWIYKFFAKSLQNPNALDSSNREAYSLQKHLNHPIQSI